MGFGLTVSAALNFNLKHAKIIAKTIHLFHPGCEACSTHQAAELSGLGLITAVATGPTQSGHLVIVAAGGAALLAVGRLR